MVFVTPQTDEGRYKCIIWDEDGNTCKKTYATTFTLANHQAKHHNNGYVCLFCPHKNFSDYDKRAFYQHCLKLHKNNIKDVEKLLHVEEREYQTSFESPSESESDEESDRDAVISPTKGAGAVALLGLGFQKRMTPSQENQTLTPSHENQIRHMRRCWL